MHHRSVLKWPGGKFRLLDPILSLLPKRQQLIEPFVGSGVVFLNSDYEDYQLSDANPDLITLYNQLKHEGAEFIEYAKNLFVPQNNEPTRYYLLREAFNHCQIPHERAALFLYLNRHGFNGLCRYNQQGIYNVPFGQYKSPYFPQAEMVIFAQKSKKALFRCADFTDSLSNITNTAAVYADPPYVPLSNTANFTQYAKEKFGPLQQESLAAIAQKLAREGVAVLLSNHDTPFTRKIYAGAQFTRVEVTRSISASLKGRQSVTELLALY